MVIWQTEGTDRGNLTNRGHRPWQSDKPRAQIVVIWPVMPRTRGKFPRFVRNLPYNWSNMVQCRIHYRDEACRSWHYNNCHQTSHIPEKHNNFTSWNIFILSYVKGNFKCESRLPYNNPKWSFLPWLWSPYKTLYSHSSSLHSGILMGINQMSIKRLHDKIQYCGNLQ